VSRQIRLTVNLQVGRRHDTARKRFPADQAPTGAVPSATPGPTGWSPASGTIEGCETFAYGVVGELRRWGRFRREYE
jgi:hypothetical protein